MGEQGIAVSVLALTPPDTQSLAPDDALRLSRIANETAAEAVSRHPRRLRAMSTLPMPAPDRVVRELERRRSWN
ncbi:amidohydrolase family protein [Micromonospora profundi]|uniref:hypothetical protein n=1 Tax=Micromonospora profundi TaxID=1420889 RepID=UPI0036B2D34F